MAINIIDGEEQESSAEIIRSAVKVSDINPEQAAQDISSANLMGVSPETFAGNRDELLPEVKAIERVPSQIEPQTETYLRESEVNLSLGGEDIDKMNAFEKRWNYYKEQISDLPRLNRDINDLISKKMDSEGGVLDEGDDSVLQSLRQQRIDMQRSAQSYGIDGVEEFGVEVVSAAGDMLRSFYDNKEIIAGAAGLGAVVGGGIGAASPIPGGAIVGATAGAAKGATGAIALVSFIDGYKQTSRSLYDELDTATKDDLPANIPHDRKANVARGVGLIAGFASTAAGLVLAKNNVFLKRFMNPSAIAKTIVNGTPSYMAKMEILGSVAKSVMSEGSEEAFQEFIQIAGENFGKMDETEASLLNALEMTLTEENLQRIAKAGAVGGATGGLIQTVTSAPAYGRIKKDFERTEYVTQQKKQVLEEQNILLQMNEDMKESKIGKLAPEELTRWQKMVFGDESIYMYLDDMRQFANSPEKGAALRNIINEDYAKLSQELDTPIAIPKAEFMKVVKEFPEVTDFMRMTPDAENPLQVRNEAKEFSGRLQEAEARRAALQEELGVEELTDEQQAQIRKDLELTMAESKYFTDRESYLGQAAIQPIEGILNAKEAEGLNVAQIEARLEIDKQVIAPVDARFERYAEAEFQTETNEMIALEIDKLSKEYEVINRFANVKDLSELDLDYTKGHKKKGFSALAIDPNSLSVAQRAIYFDQNDLQPSIKRNMKQRKVFVEGGLSVDEAAMLAGVETPDQLLKILAETPTKKQIEQRIKNDPLRNATRPDQISESMDNTREVARDEAFTKLTRSHLKEMQIMVEKSWPTMKRGIIKIAKKVPTVKALNDKAKSTINRMRIGDIDPRMYEQGEKRTHKAAIESFTDGKIEQAFDLKERAALNNEMRKEAVKAQDKVAKYQKFWKKAKDPSVIQELRDAGMSDVMEEYMALYKLDGNIKGETEQKSFNKFIKQQSILGNFTPKVPDRLNNTQASYKDLTVEQYQMMTEMGQFILEQARLKNKLLKKAEIAAELETQETIREGIAENLQNHFDYKEGRAQTQDIKSKDQQFIDKLKNMVKTGISAVKNIDSIIDELDQHKRDGYFYKLIGDPIAKATTAERLMNGDLLKRGDEIIKEFYGDVKSYQKMLSERVEIAEFKGFNIGDGDGYVLKQDLLYMLAHFGDAYATEQLSNFTDSNGVNIEVDTIKAVLERELTVNDAKFVQNFFLNTLKGFKEPSRELHKKTTGVEPEMIEGTTFVFKDVVFEGGYFPVEHKMLTAEERVAQDLEGIAEGPADEGRFYARLRSAEMTEQGRLKSRTGSRRAIDLDYNNFFNFIKETVHDLNFRETGIDTLKILKDPENAKNIKNVIGSDKFGVLLDSIKDVISDRGDEGTPLFGKQFGWVEKMVNKATSLHAVQAIGFNVGSAMIQADALNYLGLRAGPKAPIYLAKTIKKLADFSDWDAHVAEAAKILPDIQLEQDQMDESFVKTAKEWNPTNPVFIKKYPTLAKGLTRLKIAREKSVDLSFELLRKADQANKVIATLALTDQFFNGDIEGYSKADIDKMSATEKVETLRRVVKQTVDLTLTASANKDKTAIEKMKLGKLLVNYWTDRRSRLNTILAQSNKVKGAVKRKDYKKAANHILWLSFATGMANSFYNLIKDEEESIINRLDDVRDAEDIWQFTKDTMWDFAKAPAVQLMQSIPVLDSALYTYDTFTSGKSRMLRPVTTPFFGVVSEGVRGAIALKDFIEDGMDIEGIPDKDRKTIITNIGYAVGGAPTNSVNKLIDLIEDNKVPKGAEHLKDQIMEIHEVFDEFIDLMKDKPEAEEIVNDVKTVKKSLPQFDANQDNIIPEDAKEVLKTSLSAGKWNAYNPTTGAAGIYQFTEDRWKQIANLNPDLGLTENGRVAKNLEQQERAMEWELQDNTRGLLMYEIPVTNANLLGAHEFGMDNFINISLSPDEDSLIDALGEEQASRPEFKNFKTVKEVKRYLQKKVSNP